MLAEGRGRMTGEEEGRSGEEVGLDACKLSMLEVDWSTGLGRE